MKLTKTERQVLRFKFGGYCSYCGCLLPDKWHADHLKAVEREVNYVRGVGYVATGKLNKPHHDHIDNMMPACIPCNIDKSDSSLNAWRKRLEQSHETLLRNYATYKHAHRFGLIKERAGPLIFHFEQFSSRPRTPLLDFET